MLNTIYSKTFACSLSLFSIHPFKIILFFSLSGLNSSYSPSEDWNLLGFLFYFTVLSSVRYSFVLQTRFLSLPPSLKERLIPFHSTWLSENSKACEKKESLPFHYGGAHWHSADRAFWQEGLACAQPRQVHICLYRCRQGCPGTHLPLSHFRSLGFYWSPLLHRQKHCSCQQRVQQGQFWAVNYLHMTDVILKSDRLKYVFVL